MPDLTEAERELAVKLKDISDDSLRWFAEPHTEPIPDRAWTMLEAFSTFAATYELTRRQRAREAEHER